MSIRFCTMGGISLRNRKEIKSIRTILVIVLGCWLLMVSGCTLVKTTTTISENKQVNTPVLSSAGKNDLKIHFIDVGQADAILVQAGASNMLIDAGNNDDEEILKSYLQKIGVNAFDVVVGTHVHEDHIGSMDYIVNSFRVGKVYFPKQTANTKTYKDFISSIKNKNLQLTAPVVGESFKIGDAVCTILAPISPSYEDANDYSIVIRIVYGESSFLFMGDATAVSEMEMVKKGLDLKADVLKVGHHGSKSSTSANFLKEVNPNFAIISVGKDNSYGHPTQTVLDRLKQYGVKTYRTDEVGTIIISSNGKAISISNESGNNIGTGSTALSANNSLESGNNSNNNYSSGNNTESNSQNSTDLGTTTGKSEKQYVDAAGNGTIKGNINSSGEKIYHMPDGAYYGNTKAERWFKTEAEAQASGFRKSLR